jgi:hypothetical protein
MAVNTGHLYTSNGGYLLNPQLSDIHFGSLRLKCGDETGCWQVYQTPSALHAFINRGWFRGSLAYVPAAQWFWVRLDRKHDSGGEGLLFSLRGHRVCLHHGYNNPQAYPPGPKKICGKITHGPHFHFDPHDARFGLAAVGISPDYNNPLYHPLTWPNQITPFMGANGIATAACLCAEPAPPSPSVCSSSSSQSGGSMAPNCWPINTYPKSYVNASKGPWHYFDEYYCADVKNINFACKPSLRKSVSRLNTVAILEDSLPIGGGNVCTLDPGNTFHFAIKVNQREVNYTEFTNCCVGLHRCCAFCFCGQDGLGINVLPFPYWSENNCDNCHSAVMTYFSSMASQIPGYTIPNVCWASTVHCNDLKNDLISFGCSLGLGYQTTASSGGSA